MAQAAVMLRPRQQDPAAAPMATPGKPPLSPAMDSSLITSTVRKRKGGCGARQGCVQAGEVAWQLPWTWRFGCTRPARFGCMPCYAAFPVDAQAALLPHVRLLQ